MADAGSIPAVVLLLFVFHCMLFQTTVGNHPRVSAVFSVVLGRIAAVRGEL